MTTSTQVGLVAAMLIALGSAAGASEHLLHVGEIMTGKNGADAVQYIELSDSNGESFPAAAYLVEVFDAAAVSLGEVSLDHTKLVAEQAAFFIATAAAEAELGKAADARLDSPLDPTGGTACFAKKVGSATTYLHCLKWGTAITPTGTSGTLETGDAPADGKSLQRQSDGSYEIADPTPKSANQAAAGSDLATSGGGGNGGRCTVGAEPSASLAMGLLLWAAVVVARRRA